MLSTRVRGAVDLPSYLAASVTYSATAAATVVFEIASPAATASQKGKLIRVHRVLFSATQTTAGNIGDWRLEKRAQSTGGTSASMTAVPLDSSQLASVASVLNYTANPTPGALVGILWQPRMHVPAPATAITPAYVFDFDTTQLLNGRPVTLRPGEALSLNFGGGTIPSGLANCQASVYWTEEAVIADATPMKFQ